MTKHKKMGWYEEYKRCSCNFISARRDELPGYCPKHFTDKRRRIKIPIDNMAESDFGYVGT